MRVRTKQRPAAVPGEQRSLFPEPAPAKPPAPVELSERKPKASEPEAVRDEARSRVWWQLGPELIAEVRSLAHEGTPYLYIHTRKAGPDSLRVGPWEVWGPYRAFAIMGERYALSAMKKETPKPSWTWLTSPPSGHCIGQRQEVERFISTSATIRKELGLTERVQAAEPVVQEDKAFPTLKPGVSTRVETDVAELGITSSAQAAVCPRQPYPVEPTIAQDKASAAVAKLLGDGKWHDFFEVWEASGGLFYQVTVMHNASYQPRDWQVRVVSRWDGPGKSFITHASSAAALTYLEQKKEAAR